MKNTNAITIVLAIAAVAIAAYFLSRPAPERVPEVPAAGQQEVFSSPDLGLEFTYPAGQEGYVILEAPFADPANELEVALILMRTEDAERTPPEGGEGPPVMLVYVFGNSQMQWPQTWADNHIQYSSIDLAMGNVREAVVGGANAIRYRTDGLYAAEAAVVAHGENMYLFVGQFMDENSAIRSDFESLLASVRFIPTPEHAGLQ